MERAAAAMVEPLAATMRKDTWCGRRIMGLDQSTELGLSIGPARLLLFFLRCESSHRYVTYLSSIGLWYETI
jgi:hypothetical protein